MTMSLAIILLYFTGNVNGMKNYPHTYWERVEYPVEGNVLYLKRRKVTVDENGGKEYGEWNRVNGWMRHPIPYEVKQKYTAWFRQTEVSPGNVITEFENKTITQTHYLPNSFDIPKPPETVHERFDLPEQPRISLLTMLENMSPKSPKTSPRQKQCVFVYPEDERKKEKDNGCNNQ